MATVNDRALVVDLLARSFDGNQSVNYIVRQDNKRKARIRALMDYSFEVCMRFGEVWLSEDRRACALVLFPEEKKTTLKTIWLDVKLIFQAIGWGGVSKAMKREALIKQKQLNVPVVYLWFIGVHPLYQHRGAGGKLLQQVIDKAKKRDRPVFLETSTLKNLPWYGRFGFQVYDELELGYTLYFLNNL